MGDGELSEAIRANMDKLAERGGVDAKELVEKLGLEPPNRAETLRDLTRTAKERAGGRNAELPEKTRGSVGMER